MISRLIQCNLTTLRLLSFCAALLLYGGWSAPTPDHLGIIESIIGGLLIFSILPSLLSSFTITRDTPLWQNAATTLLIFGLSAPLIVAAINAAPINLMLRDIIPFGFMMLPLFMAPLLKKRPASFQPLFLATLSIAILFTLRSLPVPLPVISNLLGNSETLDYLANMPTLLMAAIFFAGIGLKLFIQEFTLKSLGKALALLALTALILTPIVLSQQRASLGAFAIAMIFILAPLIWESPRRSLTVLIMLTALSLPFWPQIADMLHELSRKSDLVGLNQRREELAAIWQEISVNPLTLLFGNGWGAGFASPAVGDIQIHFTHSLLSSFLLKTGLIGLGLAGLYLYGLARLLWPLLQQNQQTRTLALALALPLLIDIALYASYKSLDFGVLLMLIPALQYNNNQKQCSDDISLDDIPLDDIAS